MAWPCDVMQGPATAQDKCNFMSHPLSGGAQQGRICSWIWGSCFKAGAWGWKKCSPLINLQFHSRALMAGLLHHVLQPVTEKEAQIP